MPTPDDNLTFVGGSPAGKPRHVAVFGSTGSIGRNALEVIRASQGALRLTAISAHSRLSLLEEQAREFRPKYVIATDEQEAAEHAWQGFAKRNTASCW